MIQDVKVILENMPTTIKGYTVAKDFTYTIVLNSRLSFESQRYTYLHELEHINNGDFEKKCRADIIEFYAHGL